MTQDEISLVSVCGSLGFRSRVPWTLDEIRTVMLLLEYDGLPFVCYEGQGVVCRVPYGNRRMLVISAEGETSAEITTVVLGVFPEAKERSKGKFQLPRELELDEEKVQFLLHHPCEGVGPTMLALR